MEREKVITLLRLVKENGLKIDIAADEICSLFSVSNSVRQEIERRRDLIISEPDGIVRETMISNLAIDL